MTQKSTLRPGLKSVPSEKTTKSRHWGGTEVNIRPKRPNDHFFHSSKYILIPKGVQ